MKLNLQKSLKSEKENKNIKIILYFYFLANASWKICEANFTRKVRNIFLRTHRGKFVGADPVSALRKGDNTIEKKEKNAQSNEQNK